MLDVDLAAFKENTVEPVWALREDIQFWLGENRDRLILGTVYNFSVSWDWWTLILRINSVFWGMQSPTPPLELAQALTQPYPKGVGGGGVIYPHPPQDSDHTYPVCVHCLVSFIFPIGTNKNLHSLIILESLCKFRWHLFKFKLFLCLAGSTVNLRVHSHVSTHHTSSSSSYVAHNFQMYTTVKKKEEKNGPKNVVAIHVLYHIMGFPD